MTYTLITFDLMSNTLIAKTVCNDYEALQQFVSLALKYDYKAFTVSYNAEYNTQCFEPKGDTTHQDIHEINRNYKDWENLYS